MKPVGKPNCRISDIWDFKLYPTVHISKIHLVNIVSAPKRGQMKNSDRKTASRLEELPNIGKAIAGDIRLVGINHPKELIGEKAFDLYELFCVTSGQRHDPCVIDVFMSVIHFMENGN